MTASEARELAYAMLGRFGIDIPTVPHRLVYNRMSIRQREIFSMVSNWDPDFYGECVVAALDDGDVNLNALEDLVEETDPYPIESIQVIRVEDPGTSALAQGDRVRIVRANDYRQVSPRVTLRSMIIRDVEGDLDGVASLKIWYVRRPREIGADGADELELPEPWHDLLSIDAALYILQRAQGDHAGVVNTLRQEEAERMSNLATHVRNAYRASEDRFSEVKVMSMRSVGEKD